VSENELSKEARILRAVKMTLAGVIRDTATPHGMQHPLSDSTIEDLRQCLALISARERELAAEESQARPRFADEPGAPTVVQFHPRKPAKDED